MHTESILLDTKESRKSLLSALIHIFSFHNRIQPFMKLIQIWLKEATTIREKTTDEVGIGRRLRLNSHQD